MESESLNKIPLLKTNAGPKDENWPDRLKEEYLALIEYVKLNQEEDNEWFQVEPNSDGTKWKGTCWYYYNFQKYEFQLQFEVNINIINKKIPATYPDTPIELELPELDGKTPKMYRGGKICLDIHFSPLWGKNVPKYGIAHALALAVI
jgi:ufm1-conjugating enzyme 1